MKRSRFSEEQIIAILKEQEAGMATADVLQSEASESGTRLRSCLGFKCMRSASRSDSLGGRCLL